MPYLTIKISDVETAIENGGKVQINIGKAKQSPANPGLFFQRYFENPMAFINAKKNLQADIQTHFPKSRFGCEMISNWGDGLGKCHITYEKIKDDRYINYYLVFEKGATRD